MRISDWSSDVCSSDLIKVPYCLRATEERQIYEKLVRGSELAKAPCAPGTLDMLARFSVLTRLREHENSNLYSKMRVYDGESLREVDPRAKSLQEYQDAAGEIGRETCRERVVQ